MPTKQQNKLALEVLYDKDVVNYDGVNVTEEVVGAAAAMVSVAGMRDVKFRGTNYRLRAGYRSDEIQLPLGDRITRAIREYIEDGDFTGVSTDQVETLLATLGDTGLVCDATIDDLWEWHDSLL